ncbi:phage exclusion lipoprotein Cor [Citrobacter koseri]|uniref:phage exclusion lipoprotein Cor n=1 Tax=Citrobacter koseri TaxID=545 RepID=UPI003D23949C
MNKVYTAAIIISSALLTAGCASNTPPLCYNEAVIMKNKVSIPFFGIRKPLKTTEYLSGGYFAYQWMPQESFTDTSTCDKRGLTE